MSPPQAEALQTAMPLLPAGPDIGRGSTNFQGTILVVLIVGVTKKDIYSLDVGYSI